MIAMKASCLLRSSCSFATSPQIFSVLQRHCKKPSYNNNGIICQHQFISYSTSPSSSLSFTSHHKPQIPLFLRQPNFSATLSDLHRFTNWAKTLVSTVGCSFEQIDNGPDDKLLLRELQWFLDDILEEPSLFPQLGASQNGDFCKETTVMVGLRASLEQMYKLWKERIEERRPFQYIVGCEHWRDLVLSVEEGVLIPRPETEKIVDLVGDVVAKCGVSKDGLWADLGTGSGALAIGIARVLSGNGRVVATDLSHVAVAVAKYNVERYGLQEMIDVKQGSWFDPLKDVEGKLAGLVSNPPYIPSQDVSGLQAEVGNHEPRLALDGGVEGMDHLISLLKRTSLMLTPGGFFAFETNGEKQSKLLADYLENTTDRSFHHVNIVLDFAGISRFVTGYRQ